MYQFKYHDSYDLEGMSEAELRRAELKDRILDLPEYDNLDIFALNRMSEQEMRDLLGPRRADPPKRAPIDPVVRAKPLRRSSLPPVVKHRAQVWIDGRNVNLGSFLTEQVRDEALALAKSMRAIGLPLETIREAVHRMK